MARRYVDSITESKWWATQTYPRFAPGARETTYRSCHRHIVVKGKRGRGCWGYNSGRIVMGDERLWRWFLLHEIAHTIAHEEPAHGPQYCAVYLALVRRWIGRDAYLLLRSEFKAHGVRYKRPRKPPTDRQRQALRAGAAKLAEWRAANPRKRTGRMMCDRVYANGHTRGVYWKRMRYDWAMGDRSDMNWYYFACRRQCDGGLPTKHHFRTMRELDRWAHRLTPAELSDIRH